MFETSIRRTALAVAVAAVTGIAFAQSGSTGSGSTSSGSTGATSGSSPSTSTPGTTGSGMGGSGSGSGMSSGTPGSATGAGSGGSARMPSRTDTADNAWRTLDSSNRGYLQRNEVSGLNGFSFEQADTNKDGRISKDEFAKAWGNK